MSCLISLIRSLALVFGEETGSAFTTTSGGFVCGGGISGAFVAVDVYVKTGTGLTRPDRVTLLVLSSLEVTGAADTGTGLGSGTAGASFIVISFFSFKRLASRSE